MPSSFFGNVMVTPVSTLSSYSTSSIGGTATTTVTIQKGSGTYTYIWTAPGCTITNGTTVTPTFIYTAAGTTNAYCTITNNVTGISIISPTFVITWSAPIPTTFTFTPSINTSYVYDATQRTITYTTNPAEATASVTAGSLSITDVGSTSGTVTASGSYTGSAISPTITITAAPISTPATWRLNGVLFSSPQTVSYTGSNYAIACTAVTPTGATYTPTSQNYSAAGSYSLTSTGTGNYQGSVTSPLLTITIVTTFTFTPSSNTSYVYDGTTRTITYTKNPADATASVTSGSLSVGPNIGSTSGTVTASGIYSGSATSPTITITAASISATAVTPAAVTYNGSLRTATVISNVVGTATGSLTASGTNAGTYTSTITGFGNYTGTFTGGNFVINRQSISGGVWTLNGASFTTAQSRTAGTTYTIVITSVTPSGAFSTLNTTSRSVSAAGSYTLVSTASGNYQGSVTSPVLTLTSAVVTGSITESSSSTAQNRILTANLSGATATSYSWVKVGQGLGTLFNTSSQTCTVNSNTINSTTTTVRCTITYSGGSVAPTYTWTWNEL